MSDERDSTTATGVLSDVEVDLIDRYWRAANYLSVGQIYLLDDPLLEVPLAPEHIKPRLLGHWGTTTGQNFLYAHLNRVIVQHDVDAIYVCGPGHGGPAVVANTYLEGVYSEIYPHIGRDAEGMGRLFRQFSFPGGIPSHAAPQTPGSINEGGELGYSLMHATGAVFDDPDLVAFCVIGDGESETGPLATSWHAPTFIDPVRDGAVVPILHLNGYKIANPTVLARLPEEQLLSLIRGWGWEPVVVAGDDPATMHRDLAAALDGIVDRVRAIQQDARSGHRRTGPERDAALDGAVSPSARPVPPRWPMLVFRSPKGWTGPRTVDGEQVEGTFRAHQVPLDQVRTNPEHLRQLDEWLRSYRAEELFDEHGTLLPELQALAPTGDRRMGANPVTNGGLLLHDLELPDFRDYAVPVESPGTGAVSATTVLGTWLRDVMKLNPDRFRLFGPDETASNRLQAVFETTDRAWQAPVAPTDDHLAVDGRVMEVLSEHALQGWLEGYLLTGRHGLLSSYEAFAHIVDSMVNQHAKWLRDVNRIPWRRDIASLNYLITSHVWRQDHNGSSHQDPGFMDHVVNKSAEIARVYLPPDTNCLLSVADHVLRSRQYINVIVAGKQPQLNYLSMDEAIAHCTRGLGIWEWASNTGDAEPDVVLACAGEIPTMEAVAAADLLRRELPDLKVRLVNVVDLMRLESPDQHPHGLDDKEFDAVFTADKPVVFAFHGFPTLVHRLTYKRSNHDQFHVHGYVGEGTTTTPFDMVLMNGLDRFSLAMDVIDRVPGLSERYAPLRQRFMDERLAARAYTYEHGEDAPAIQHWEWPRG